MHVDEDEAATQGVVHHRQRAVGSVHRANDVDVLRYVERVLAFLGVGQGRPPRLAALVCLDEKKKLAEDLAQVPAVDLIDDQHIRSSWVLERLITEPHEWPIDASEAAAVH